MVPFEIEIELNNMPVSVQVEQLDYLADENGRMHYDVRSGLRQAVIDFRANLSLPLCAYLWCS